uniref:Uncharacterized protein n=1 Tax=Picea sitchensis TaxID=3332 RepID=D5A991_PICSI|nr:unknown [Picea sitchensis]
MTEMWLKSFGVVEEGTSISHSHSWQKTTEKFNASSREMEKHQPAATAECTMEISATAECTMESSAKSDSTGSRNIKDNCCHDAATAECTMESSATAECTMESSAKSGRQLIYYRRHYRRPYYRRNIKD